MLNIKENQYTEEKVSDTEFYRAKALVELRKNEIVYLSYGAFISYKEITFKLYFSDDGCELLRCTKVVKNKI